MGVVVNFDYGAWSTLFPQFCTTTTNYTAIPQSTVTGVLLTAAQVYCRNDGGGPVNDAGVQAQLLNFMVAHLAQLMFGSTVQPLSPLVGRVSGATEGSVSVQVDMPAGSPSSAWYMQTTYGALFWQLSSPYRTMRYLPQRRSLGWPRRGW